MYFGCPNLSHSRSYISATIWDIYEILSVFKSSWLALRLSSLSSSPQIADQVTFVKVFISMETTNLIICIHFLRGSLSISLNYTIWNSWWIFLRITQKNSECTANYSIWHFLNKSQGILPVFNKDLKAIDVKETEHCLLFLVLHLKGRVDLVYEPRKHPLVNGLGQSIPHIHRLVTVQWRTQLEGQRSTIKKL